MTIVVFGDSIAVGQCVSPHLAWVTRVSAAVPEHLVVNAGYNGDTTRLALLRMAHDVPPCDVLVVQFGLNDANVWASEGTVRVGARAFAANLREIADRTRAKVIFHTNHRTATGSPDYEARVRRYNEIVCDVAAECGALVVDVEAADIDLLDGIHPSAAGHEQYAELALPAIREALA